MNPRALHVRARIVDIRSDQPTPDDRILLDTNVLTWIVGCRSGQGTPQPQARHYQLYNYPRYVTDALRAKAILYRCGVSFTELAHHIERTEFHYFLRRFPHTSQKNFRHGHPKQRQAVTTQIHAAWNTVKSFTEPIGTTMSDATITSVCRQLHSMAIGPFDLILLESMRDAGLSQLLSDDSDFATVDGLMLFTANPVILNAAKAQGKLLLRSIVTSSSSDHDNPDSPLIAANE